MEDEDFGSAMNRDDFERSHRGGPPRMGSIGMGPSGGQGQGLSGRFGGVFIIIYFNIFFVLPWVWRGGGSPLKALYFLRNWTSQRGSVLLLAFPFSLKRTDLFSRTNQGFPQSKTTRREKRCSPSKTQRVFG